MTEVFIALSGFCPDRVDEFLGAFATYEGAAKEVLSREGGPWIVPPEPQYGFRSPSSDKWTWISPLRRGCSQRFVRVQREEVGE